MHGKKPNKRNNYVGLWYMDPHKITLSQIKKNILVAEKVVDTSLGVAEAVFEKINKTDAAIIGIVKEVVDEVEDLLNASLAITPRK